MSSGRRGRIAVIGAGPAGLAATLTLSRSLQHTLLFDAPSSARNAASKGVAAVAGRDLLRPDALKASALGEIERYGFATFIIQSVVAIEGDLVTGFRVHTDEEPPHAVDRIILTCGMIDEFPRIEGIELFWGTTVINCPFCDGFELRDLRWSVLISRRDMLDVAEIYRVWTKDLMLFIEPVVELSSQRRDTLEHLGVTIETRRARRLHGENSQLRQVELDDGTFVARDVMVVWPPQRQTDLVRQLDIPLDDAGCIIIDDSFRTQVPGIYAAGDIVYAGHQNVNTGMHMGNLAAASAVLDLAMNRQ